MGQYLPKSYVPGGFAVSNGAPTLATDVLEIDKYATWLAAVAKPQIPCIVPPSPWTSGTTSTVEIPIPQYTAGVALGLLVSGQGSVEVNCDDDSYNADTGSIIVGDGVLHAVDDAQWLWIDVPITVAADGTMRALDTTNQSSPHWCRFEFDITDAGGGATLEVWAAKGWYLLPDDSAALPA